MEAAAEDWSAQRAVAPRTARMLNGVQGMVGETALVTRAISGTHRPGTIRARGEDWLAVPLDPSESIDEGADVVVAGVERGLLLVYPVGAR